MPSRAFCRCLLLRRHRSFLQLRRYNRRVEAKSRSLPLRWNSSCRLLLRPAHLVNRAQLHRLIVTPKDTTGVGGTLHEVHLRTAGQHIPQGFLFVDLRLRQDERISVCCDDLAQCFPSFTASEARACTNGVASVLPRSAFRRSHAVKSLPQGARVER